MRGRTATVGAVAAAAALLAPLAAALEPVRFSLVDCAVPGGSIVASFPAGSDGVVRFAGVHSHDAAAGHYARFRAAWSWREPSPQAVGHLIDAAVAAAGSYAADVLPYALADVVLTAADPDTGAPLRRGDGEPPVKVASGRTAGDALDGVAPSLLRSLAGRTLSFWVDPLGIFAAVTNATVGAGASAVSVSGGWGSVLDWLDAEAARAAADDVPSYRSQLATLSPFRDAFVALRLPQPSAGDHYSAYAVSGLALRCSVNRVAFRHPALGLVGLYLDFNAASLAHSVALYYSGGLAFGFLAALLLAVMVLYRNRRSPALIGAGVVGAAVAGARRVGLATSSLLAAVGLGGSGSGDESSSAASPLLLMGLSTEHLPELLAGYALLTTAIVATLLYLHGPIRNERAFDVLAGLLRMVAAGCVYNATSHGPTAAALAGALLLRGLLWPVAVSAFHMCWLLLEYSPLYWAVSRLCPSLCCCCCRRKGVRITGGGLGDIDGVSSADGSAFGYEGAGRFPVTPAAIAAAANADLSGAAYDSAGRARSGSRGTMRYRGAGPSPSPTLSQPRAVLPAVTHYVGDNEYAAPPPAAAYSPAGSPHAVPSPYPSGSPFSGGGRRYGTAGLQQARRGSVGSTAGAPQYASYGGPSSGAAVTASSEPRRYHQVPPPQAAAPRTEPFPGARQRSRLGGGGSAIASRVGSQPRRGQQHYAGEDEDGLSASLARAVDLGGSGVDVGAGVGLAYNQQQQHQQVPSHYAPPAAYAGGFYGAAPEPYYDESGSGDDDAMAADEDDGGHHYDDGCDDYGDDDGMGTGYAPPPPPPLQRSQPRSQSGRKRPPSQPAAAYRQQQHYDGDENDNDGYDGASTPRSSDSGTPPQERHARWPSASPAAASASVLRRLPAASPPGSAAHRVAAAAAAAGPSRTPSGGVPVSTAAPAGRRGTPSATPLLRSPAGAVTLPAAAGSAGRSVKARRAPLSSDRY